MCQFDVESNRQRRNNVCWCCSSTLSMCSLRHKMASSTRSSSPTAWTLPVRGQRTWRAWPASAPTASTIPTRQSRRWAWACRWRRASATSTCSTRQTVQSSMSRSQSIRRECSSSASAWPTTTWPAWIQVRKTSRPTPTWIEWTRLAFTRRSSPCCSSGVRRSATSWSWSRPGPASTSTTRSIRI